MLKMGEQLYKIQYKEESDSGSGPRKPYELNYLLCARLFTYIISLNTPIHLMKGLLHVYR